MKTNITRRTLLRGIGGVALGLPLLECMMGRSVAASPVEIPKRFLALYVGHGFSLTDDWNFFPSVVDGKMNFSKSMDAFAPLAERVSFIRGMEHPRCTGGNGHETADSFLTGSNPNEAVKSPSLDQIAAAIHGKKTRYPSLVLGNEGGMGGNGSSLTLSYNQFGRPIPSSNDIRGLYDAMFNSDPGQGRDQRRRLAADKRRVDRVLESYKNLKRELGREDSRKLEHYLEAVRDVEKEIERLELWMDKPKPQIPSDALALDASVKDPEGFIRTMYNLIYLAFRTDSTRYATYMLLSMAGTGPWNSVVLPSHHGAAHAGGTALGEYDKFQARLLAEFITKLKETPEADGTMLDNTIVYYGSSNSVTHVNSDYPLMLIGGEKLGLRHGKLHEMGAAAPPLSNLYLTLLNALDVSAERFSDSTAPLPQIMA
jgi:hypothetical protein